MKQFAMTVALKDDPEKVAAYRRYHENIWPEVRSALHAVGIQNLSIWLLGRRLFMLVTARDDFDPETDFPRYLRVDPLCQEWEDLMSTLQEPVPEARPGEKWALMEEIFRLNRD